MKPLAVETIVTGHTPTDTMSMAQSKRFLYSATSKDEEVLIWDKSSRAPAGRMPSTCPPATMWRLLLPLVLCARPSIPSSTPFW